MGDRLLRPRQSPVYPYVLGSVDWGTNPLNPSYLSTSLYVSLGDWVYLAAKDKGNNSMPVRRPSLLTPSRQGSVEPWMAWRRLHCLNPSIHTGIERAGYDGYSRGVRDSASRPCAAPLYVQ